MLDIDQETWHTAAMRSAVLVVQNDPGKPLGEIADALVAAGVGLDVRSPESDLPAVVGYAGLIVLPGLADPVDEDIAVERAREAIHAALELDLPILGLCLGGQLLAQALGGNVYPCQPELGFGEVFASPAAFTDPLLAGVPEQFSVFHAHAFAYEPPAGAEVLLTNDVCAQACRQGEAWAFQCHPEISREWVTRLAAGLRGEDDGVPAGTRDFFARNQVSPEQLERGARLAQDAVSRVAQGIARGFASRLG
jgi:GMP synthase-like glutamine amidotransferase